VLPAEFRAPDGWRWGAALDFGYAGGWFGLFACGERQICCMDEIYLKQVHAYEAGRRCALKVLEAKVAVEYVAIDSAMQQQHGTGVTVAEEFQKGWDAVYGGPNRGPRLIPATKGPGSRPAGVQQMHHALAYRTDEKGQVPPWWHPQLKFHPRCSYAIRTIPSLPHDPADPEDVDTDADDHAYDAIRYFLASRAEQVLKPHPWQERADPDNAHPGYDYEHRERQMRPWERSLRGLDRPQGGGGRFLPQGPLRPVDDSDL
jgi:hypothetical protein